MPRLLQPTGLPSASGGHGLSALHVWVHTVKFDFSKKWQFCDSQSPATAHQS